MGFLLLQEWVTVIDVEIYPVCSINPFPELLLISNKFFGIFSIACSDFFEIILQKFLS